MEIDLNNERTKRDDQTNNTSTEINKNNEMTNPNHTNNIDIKINENNEMTKQNDNMETYDTNNDGSTQNNDTQPTTSNANNHIKTQTTKTNNNMINIPPHLLTTFQILYRLKTRLSQLEATLENLQEHKRTNTVPTGLRIKHKNKSYMEKQLRERWDSTLSEASTALLNITIEHHEQCIQDTKNKIQHKTAQIQLKCDATTAERIIHKTDQVHIKHTERSLKNSQKLLNA